MTVSVVLERTKPSFCLSYKTQCQEMTVTVLAVSAVVAVWVVTATLLKLNPPLLHPDRVNSRAHCYQSSWKDQG